MRELSIITCSLILLGCASRPSKAWQTKGILTDDYGIVTLADIQKNKKIARPFDRSGDPMLVWQCLPVERFNTFCRDLGFVVDLGEKGYTSGLKIVSKGNEYSFECPKFTGRRGCGEDERAWTKLIRQGQIACFSGFYVGKEPSSESGLKDWSLWNMERIKSKRGEWSYWVN